MALVFKIKFNDILRRWVVSENFNANAFSLTLSQLQDKIRELFHLSATASLIITYLDKENDVVTLGDDQDLVDACLVQQLNPLRVNVHVKKISVQESAAMPSSSSYEAGNLDAILKGFLPRATANHVKNIVKASTQILDPKHLAGVVGGNGKKGFLGGGLNVGSDLTAISPPHIPVAPNLRAFGAYHVFHSGIQCDGCGMTPIEGLRYKSTKVPDYDLCSGCYDLMGTEGDFEKIEHPLRSNGRSFFSDRASSFAAAPSWRPSFRQGPYAWMPECPFSGQGLAFTPFDDHHRRLNAQFVKDVTISDGTEVGPGTQFTKIWRMANSGSLPWPQGTQLVYVEGDTLGSVEMVNVELPEGGLPGGQEIEISANLTAPDVVGHYISHWRLLSPSGQKFGHRVWVMIQVIPQVNTSVKEEESYMNVDVNNGQDSSEASAEKGTFSAPRNVNADEKDEVEDGSTCMADMHEVEDGAVLSDQGKQPVLDTEMDIELDGFSVVEKPVEIPSLERESFFPKKEMTKTDLETELKELESLGFDNREQNLHWLKRSEGSMQGALENLVLCAGWGEIIRNLRAMGFDDQSANIRLLHKHKGSIKLVVKDLVKMENQKEG